MWWRVMGDVKCSRGDCVYYNYNEASIPCSRCNANMRNKDNMSKSFNFKSKDVGQWFEAEKARKKDDPNEQGGNKPTPIA